MTPLIIPLSLSNVYLLACEDGYLQIDTGYQKDYSLVREKLNELDISISLIKYVFLTHHHDDHAGFLNEITRDCDCKIIANKLSVDLLKTGQNDKTRGGGYVNRLVKVVADIKMLFDKQWTLTFPPFEIRDFDLLIDDDNTTLLNQLGINGKILYTPGHCVDHQTIILRDGTTFCGDAASSFPLFLGTRYSTLFMTNMEQSYQSWKKIIDSGSKLIYPSHGKPFAVRKLQDNIGKIKTSKLVKFFLNAENRNPTKVSTRLPLLLHFGENRLNRRYFSRGPILFDRATIIY